MSAFPKNAIFHLPTRPPLFKKKNNPALINILATLGVFFLLLTCNYTSRKVWSHSCCLGLGSKRLWFWLHAIEHKLDPKPFD